MTATRNTILAFGLMLLALAAGKSALGASSPSDGCGTCSCDATCGTGSNPTCEAGYEAAGTTGNFAGCPGPAANSTKKWSMDDEPWFKAGAGCFQDLREICEGCTWKADASVLYLHRSTPGSRTLLTDPSGAGLFDATQLEFPYEAGPRISLTALDCEGWGFEANYFGIDGWSTTTDIPHGSLPSGRAFLVIDSVNKIPLSDAHFESIARLYSTELNFRRPLSENFSVLAGFRWLEMTDNYLAEGHSFATTHSVTETILTHNNLYGFQIGADGTLAQQPDRWRITGFVKAGIFLNDADQATSLSDPADGVSFAVNSSNQTCAAFFGETGIVGYFQITKHLSASGGYQIMFANNVAQPVNQLAGTNLVNGTATVDVSSGLFYQGATAGLEVTW